MRLRKSAGKSMEEASEILFEALEKVMDDDLTTDDDDDEETGELGSRRVPQPRNRYSRWPPPCRARSFRCRLRCSRR